VSAFTVDELSVPATLDGPGGVDFIEMVAVRNAVETSTVGSPDLEYRADELLPFWLDMAYEPKRLFVARVAGHIVARAIYEVRLEGSPDVAWMNVEVLPEHRGKGIGSALLAEIEALADADGRSVRQCYSIARSLPGKRLDSPTGFGSVPIADPGVSFLRNRGWSLEQVERSSRLALPVPDIAERLQSALARSGPDFRVQTWVGRTPERWLEDIALLSTRMSTDAPSGGMDESEEVWTVERVLEYEERLDESPRISLFAAVEHIPSGHLVGYTELSVPPELHRAVSQEDTIVMREHRGHKLGMLVKVANLAQLHELHPGHPSVTTFNAEENRHMLDVNEAVGFVAVAYEGAWRKAV